MNLTFREKTLWLSLVSLVVVYAVYFATALSDFSAQIASVHVSAFVGMLIILITIQIVGNTVLAIANRRELAASVQSDERDTLIRLKGTQLGFYVLVIGVFVSLCLAVLVPGNFVFVHVLLAFWVLAQATETLSRLIFYRRGV